MNLIIVCGWPATGKSSIAQKLARELHLPLLSKDDIKECLFDSLGYEDRAYSMKLGAASYQLLFAQIDRLLAGGVSLVTETTFDTTYDSPAFTKIINEHHPRVLQLLVTCEIQENITRFSDRAHSRQRHPGHCDHTIIEHVTKRIQEEEYQLLNIDSDVITIDTTDFDESHIAKVIEQVRLWCSGA